MIVGGDGAVMELEEEEEEQEWYGHGVGVVSELEICVARIRELRAELGHERRARRKAETLSEALAVELAEERRRGVAARAECERMREEAGAMRAEVERALEEVEDERRMLRVAELWREERVQMKLADASAAVEDRLREIAGAGRLTNAAATAVAEGSSPSASGKRSPAKPSPESQTASGLVHRRDAATGGGGGGENPHIARGIKGFVEFPRAARPRPREERAVDLVSNLECQRAQLRVLTRHRRNPPAGMAPLVAASDSLVV